MITAKVRMHKLPALLAVGLCVTAVVIAAGSLGTIALASPSSTEQIPTPAQTPTPPPRPGKLPSSEVTAPAAATTAALPAQTGPPADLHGLGSASSADESQPTLKAALTAARARHHRVEITALSTISTSQIANPNGSISMVDYGHAVFHKEGVQRVQDDPTLAASSDPEYTRVAAHAVHPLALGRTADQLLRWQLPGGVVTGSIPSAQPVSGIPTDSTAVSYMGALPSADLVAKTTGNGVGLDLVLNSTAAPPGLRHIEGLSGFGGRWSSRRMVAGLRAAARRAAAMLSAPASRRAVVTRLRMQARTAGALPVRARWASSR